MIELDPGSVGALTGLYIARCRLRLAFRGAKWAVPRSAWAGKICDEATVPARQTAVDRKNTFYSVPAAEVANWHKPADGVIADWDKEVGAKGFDGQKLIGEAKALMN